MFSLRRFPSKHQRLRDIFANWILALDTPTSQSQTSFHHKSAFYRSTRCRQHLHCPSNSVVQLEIIDMRFQRVGFLRFPYSIAKKLLEALLSTKTPNSKRTESSTFSLGLFVVHLIFELAHQMGFLLDMEPDRTFLGCLSLP